MTGSEGVVDWGLAGRVARAVSGGDEEPSAPLAPVRTVCEDALERVLAYTRLQPGSAIPEGELVSRDDWITSNLAELRELAAPLEARAAGEISLPGPLAGLVRSGMGAAGGLEAGAVVGYASRRVLGQYQVGLGPEPRPPRMLLVERNLDRAARELGADPERFLMWVAIHEQTHAVQFAAVPWLRDHVAGLVARLIAATTGTVDLKALVALARRAVARDPRRAIRQALRGELTRALAGPEQAAIIDELQAVMAVIEGYAEHVMDAAAADDAELTRMRRALDERRARRGGLADAIARALGMGMKLRQYELGKSWCDSVAAKTGIEGLNRVWSSPGALPSPAELERPGAWLERVAGIPAAA